ncbi:nudix hydrolase 8-like [Mangifera indica]|uniref:nudix hydrolase 8-like n=1 Tax=Mangifera indica TaxID=29780 RepID=UPI001CF93649|nr:nudix hydrolase 8-like [Mangifera indica]XP_044476570.1 nudix hydrolase 8-like [Mangifera indica]
MELKLFDFKSVSGITHSGRLDSSYFSSFRYGVGVRFSSKLCSCRGAFPRVFVSSISENAYLTKKAIGSSDPEKLIGEDYIYRINRAYGASSILFSGNTRVLEAFDDEYEGVVVNPEGLPTNPDAFSSVLRFSLTHWRRRQKKGVWLKLPLERSELVPIAVKEGFQYHHAEAGYVMLTYWIPEGPCMLPANATHQVGVGGFVINHNNEVLVVQEKYCWNPAFANLWKLPTGFICESEEIFQGVVREVKEETGIDTEFVEVVAFRHAHHLAFEKSDLFFICMLTPLSAEIQVDDFEIQAAKWMPLAEFVEQPLIQEDSMFKKVIDISIARLKKRYCGLFPHRLVSTFDGQTSSLYYNDFNTQDPTCASN